MKLKNKERHYAPLEQPLDKIISPLQKFLANQTSSGILLVLAAGFAIVFANVGYYSDYLSLVNTSIGLNIGELSVEHSLKHWVNDFLMVFFFFILGLEVKWELLAGDLKDLSQARLVIFMAAGGMFFPALIYLILAQDSAAYAGWGIPMATDTAFAIAVLSLLGNRVLKSVAVLLTALAIVDDIGAVLVIAFFYSEGITWSALGYGSLVFLFMLGLNRAGVRHPMGYLSAGLLLWVFIQQAGIHPTTAGILAALTVPERPALKRENFTRRLKYWFHKLDRSDKKSKSILNYPDQHLLVEEVKEAAVATTTPMQHWETVLSRPVSFIVVPIFALLNAGVLLPGSLESLVNSDVTMAIIFALVFGKGLGISAFAYVSLKLGWAQLPEGLNMLDITGLSFLAGIGFTMSLFIGNLAFSGSAELLTEAKLGILIGSIVACTAGVVLLLIRAKRLKES